MAGNTGASGSFIFEADSDKLEEMASAMNKKIESAKGFRDSIANTITTLSTDGSWSGDASELFVEKTNSYKDEFEEMTKCLEAYVEVIKDVSGAIDSLNEEIKIICGRLG